MASKVKKNKVNFKGKMVNIGIDMHKISWRVTALVEGDVVLAITLARPNYEAFKKVISRFKTADELAAYLGLTPSQYSSGEHIRMGHITHAGNARARTTLVESSWLLIGKDPEIKRKYQRIKEKRGGKRAIVAVARNLSGRIRRMLLDQVPYELNFQKAA